MEQEQLGASWEQTLREMILHYPERSRTLWHRSYDSVETYLTSLQPNRQTWSGMLQPPAGFVQTSEICLRPGHEQEKIISLALHPSLTLEALYLEPAADFAPPFPLVLFQHGIGGTAEMVMGENDTRPASYHRIARLLTREGFAVLAPRAINNFSDRGRINRMALLLGSTIWALEVSAIRALLHAAISRLAVDPERVAMWGFSMGGAYTLYTMPLESIFKAGIVSAWFNHRCNKMVVKDPRYSCFLYVDEEHAFLPGLLTGYSDQDLVSLICPRPLLIQTGESDDIAWPPLVEEEFLCAKKHYDLLNIAERIQWDRFDGGHEIRPNSAISFFKKWLL
jgi:dienelactone hydrolase